MSGVLKFFNLNQKSNENTIVLILDSPNVSLI